MNSPAHHYATAERLADEAGGMIADHPQTMAMIALAQVHAMLATANINSWPRFQAERVWTAAAHEVIE